MIYSLIKFLGVVALANALPTHVPSKNTELMEHILKLQGGTPKGAGVKKSNEFDIMSQLLTGVAEPQPENQKVAGVLASMSHFVHAAEEMQDQLHESFLDHCNDHDRNDHDHSSAAPYPARGVHLTWVACAWGLRAYIDRPVAHE